MPKFPKAFARRKSTANALEDVAVSPIAEQSFKVFERSDGGSKSFDGGMKFAKVAGTSSRPRTAHLEEDNMFENLGNNRGSGASNTNTASTTDNSSRLSAASTTPSSTEHPGRDEWRTVHDKTYNDIPVPPVPKSASSFSLKTAGRSLSWGRNKPSTPPSSGKELPSLPVEEEASANRARGMTASSYASTATPPKLNEGLSLGGDFSDMFSGFGKRKSAILEPAANTSRSNSPEANPSGPASRNSRFNQPSRLNIDNSKSVEPSPYSWNSQHSNDGLISNSSPPPIIPHHNSPPPVPQHGVNGGSPNFSKSDRADAGIKRGSGFTGRRQSTLEHGEAVDEDAKLLRESVNANRRMNDPGYSSRVRDSWALPPTTSYKVDDTAASSWRSEESAETTPRAKKAEPKIAEDNMFDSQIAASADLAQRFQESSISPPTIHAPHHKVMTPAQFERYRQDKERLRSVGGQSRDEDDDEEETYDDDEDEAEKAKQLAKQRRKQEAHMAVYRQQMMKVTGEAGPVGGATRPTVMASQSSPNLMDLGRGDDGEEEDEEVPLGILQAHGFPNKNKPPMRSMGSNPNLRATTQSIVAGEGGARLPVFARNLPQDPYYGAGLQNPMHRESMAFGGGAGSVNGAPPQRGLPPGGLVGVIATEERSRAMRRGSPNPQGNYDSPGSFNGMGVPPNVRASTAGSMYNGMGPMNPMMMTPGDQAQIQMSQQMQQFMQMQMQFMQMMTSGQGPPPNGQVPQQGMMGDMPGPNSSQHLRPDSAQPTHQRAMTMMDPNAAPWAQQGGLYAPSFHPQGGYAPSIAPSERSNIGLPGRYRPVSHMPPPDNKSRTSTMSGALNGWDNKTEGPTIRAVKKSDNVSDEDDEEGWEEMAKKREKKKTIWRTKKDTNGFKDILNFAQ